MSAATAKVALEEEVVPLKAGAQVCVSSVCRALLFSLRAEQTRFLSLRGLVRNRSGFFRTRQQLVCQRPRGQSVAAQCL